jgi:hypothetical protein
MHEDRIQALLREADAAAGPPPPAAGLADRVLALARHRRRVRLVTAGGGLMLLILAACLSWLLSGGRRAPKPIGRPALSWQQVERIAAGVEQLRLEAEAGLSLAARMADAQDRRRRLAALQAALQRPDPLQRIRAEADETARCMVRHAWALHRRLGLPAEARRQYRRVVELFPRSPWAQVARRELTRLEPNPEA